jgi:hypothetical protein
LKIVIANYVLCDGVTTSPKDIKFDIDRQTQVAKGLRWKAAVPFDRLNEQTTVTFTIERYQASIAAGEKFCATHQLSVPNSGMVQFTFWDGSSAWMNLMLCPKIENSHNGRTTFHHYTLIGGQVSLQKPGTT